MSKISRVGRLHSTGRPRPNISKTAHIFRPRDAGWYGEDWDAVSSFIRRRDNYTCLAHTLGLPRCEKHYPPPFASRLHVHHKVPLPRGTNDPGNLVTLCIECHEKVHGRSLRKRNKS